MRRPLAALVRASLGLLVLAASLLASIAYHVTLPETWGLLSREGTTLLNGTIRGSVRIGRVESLSADGAILRHVEVFDASGTRVIVGDRLDVRMAPAALLRGTVHIRSATLTGGTLRLLFDDGSTPSFIHAFEPRQAGAGGGAPTPVQLDDVRLSGVTVYGDVPGQPGLRVEGVALRGSVASKDELEIRFHGGQGTLTAPFPFVAGITGLSGRFHTDDVIGLTLRAAVDVPRPRGDHARVQLAYRAPTRGAPQELDLLVAADPVHGETLHEAGQGWAKVLRGPLRGHVRFHGPVDDLRVEGHPDTAGGRAHLAGRFRPGQVEVTVSAQRLALADVVNGAPAITVSGSATLRTEPGPEGPTQRVALAIDGFDYGGYAVPPFSLTGTLDNTGFRIDEASARGAGNRLTLRGAIATGGNATLHASGMIGSLEREPNVQRVMPGVRGTAQGSVEIARAGGAWRVRIDARIANFRYGAVTAEELHVWGWVTERSGATSVALDTRARGTRISDLDWGMVAARIDGGPSHYRTTLRATAPGNRTLEAKAHVARDPDATRVVVESLALSHQGRTYRGHVLGARFAPSGAWDVEELLLTEGAERLEAHGGERADGTLHVEAQAKDLALHRWLDVAGFHGHGITGRWNTRLAGSGTRDALTLRLEGTIDDGKVRNVPVNLAYVATYEAGHMKLDAQADFMGRGQGTLTGEILVDTAATTPREALTQAIFDLDLHVRGLDAALLDPVTAPSGARARGPMSGTVHLGGALFAPELRGELIIPDVDIPGWPTLAVDTTFRYENSYLVARVRAEDRRGELAEVEGSLLVDLVALATAPSVALASLGSLPWRVAVRSPSRPIADWPTPLRDRLPDPLHEARVSLTGTFAGGAFKTHGDLVAAIAWGGADALGFCNTKEEAVALVEARLENDITHAEVHGFVGTTPLFSLRASAPTPLNEWLASGQGVEVPPIAVRGFARDVPVSSIPILCRTAQGRLTAALDLKDALTPEVHGTAEVHSASLQFGKVAPFRVDMELTLTPDEILGQAAFGWWTSDRAKADISLPLLWAKGARVPTIDESNGVIAIDVQNAPVEPFAALLPKVDDAGGRLDGVIEVRGRPGAMDMSGELRVSDGHLQLSTTGQRLTGVTGSFILHTNWIEIDDIHAFDGTGSLRVAGALQFEGWRPRTMKLALHGDHFPIRHEGAELATLTGIAAIDGEFTESADLVLSFRELAIDIPTQSERRAQPLDSHPDIVLAGRAGANANETPYVISMVLDATTPFWVRRNDFAVQVSAEMNATYANPDLFLSGFIEMKDGHFAIYGRNFQIDWGAINFDGTAGIDPSVNFSAEHRLRGGGSVTVTVSGTLQRPQIVFSSTEATDPGEIVSLLVTGRAKSRSSDTGEAERQTADFVGGFLSGFLSLTLREAFGNYLPQFAVDSSGFRAGYQLDFLIPAALEDVVLGVYFEGQLASNANTDDGAGGSTAATQNQASTTQQLLLELQFPYDLFFEGLWAPPDRWRLDVLWEP